MAIREVGSDGAFDQTDAMDQQTLLQQLLSAPNRPVATTPGATTRVSTPGLVPSDNGGITGGMDKTVAGPGMPGEGATGWVDNERQQTTPGSSSGADTPATTTGGASAATTNPAWDTNGYSAPSYTASSFGSAMPGWDQTKWTDPNNQHPKYVVGRILKNHNFDDAGTQDAVKEIMQAYPGTTFDGKDKITIPGVGTVDFRTGAGAGGTGWQWDTGEAAGAPAPAKAPLLDAGGQPASSALTSLSEPSTYTKLMKLLQGNLGDAATDQQTLMSQLAS